MGRVHDSSFHGAWFPKLSSRVWPNFSRTLTLPHLLPSITLLSMFWISFFSSDSGVKGTNRTFSGEWFVVGGLLLAGGWSVSVFGLFLSVLNHVAF